MSACRTQRPRRSGLKWSNAARTSACRCRRDAGWPGKRGAHCALAVPFRRSHNAPRPWPFAGGGSWSVSRPPGRRPSSSCPMRQHSCHSAAACSAAGAPADRAGRRTERARACRVAAAGCRGARRRERTSASTRACWPNARLPLTAGGHRCAGGWCARAAGDGGALARAAARRFGGVRRRVLVKCRAHQRPAAGGG